MTEHLEPERARARLTELLAAIVPCDDLAATHRGDALAWVAATDDLWRRAKPATPSPHLVAYFLLVDWAARRVLLCDHRLSGLWLPTGGHVEPLEDPVDTVRRECTEELGVPAVFDPLVGDAPFLVTVTETVGDPASRHTDVSLWFALSGRTGQALSPDEREFAGVRWWSAAEVEAADNRFDPHLRRALTALGLDG